MGREKKKMMREVMGSRTSMKSGEKKKWCSYIEETLDCMRIVVGDCLCVGKSRRRKKKRMQHWAGFCWLVLQGPKRRGKGIVVERKQVWREINRSHKQQE